MIQHDMQTLPDRRATGGFGALCALFLALPAGAEAQDWTFTVAPYIWGAGLSGTAGTLPGVPPANFDLSFGDILDNLDAAAFLVLGAHNGRWGVTADFEYVKTSSGGVTPGPLFGATALDATTEVFQLTGEYQIAYNGDNELWLAAGARYWSVDTTFSLSAGALPARSVSGSDSWWDPVIGLRGRAKLGERTFATGWAYLGGFGAGSDSFGDVFAGIGYEFTPTTSLVGGWRYYAVDRTDGSFVWDVSQSGPIVGLTFRF